MTLNAVTDGTTSFELLDLTKHVEPPADRPDIEHESVVSRTDGIRVAVVAVTAALVWFRVWEPFPRVSLLGLAARSPAVGRSFMRPG